MFGLKFSGGRGVWSEIFWGVSGLKFSRGGLNFGGV